MPLITVNAIEGVFDKNQKAQIIHDLTDAMVKIEGEGLRGITWVVINEVSSGDWGIGGNAITTDDALALGTGR
jgi:4-oxalocrotonate tautomerase